MAATESICSCGAGRRLDAEDENRCVGLIGKRSAGNGSADIFVASYSPTGGYRWVEAFGGTSGDGWQGGHVTTDTATNDVIVTSSFEGTADFGTASLTSAGSDDVCVVKLQP